MAAKRRRRFCWIRKLPSGRWQASYIDPKGRRRLAPTTFPSKPEAGDWLTEQESLIIRRSGSILIRAGWRSVRMRVAGSRSGGA
jgi:hypothetical protein